MSIEFSLSYTMLKGCQGRDRIEVGFTTTCTISAALIQVSDYRLLGASGFFTRTTKPISNFVNPGQYKMVFM
jgi:hypothetical protein